MGRRNTFFPTLFSLSLWFFLVFLHFIYVFALFSTLKRLKLEVCGEERERGIYIKRIYVNCSEKNSLILHNSLRFCWSWVDWIIFSSKWLNPNSIRHTLKKFFNLLLVWWCFLLILQILKISKNLLKISWGNEMKMCCCLAFLITWMTS